MFGYFFVFFRVRLGFGLLGKFYSSDRKVFFVNKFIQVIKFQNRYVCIYIFIYVYKIRVELGQRYDKRFEGGRVVSFLSLGSFFIFSFFSLSRIVFFFLEGDRGIERLGFFYLFILLFNFVLVSNIDQSLFYVVYFMGKTGFLFLGSR